VSICRALVHDPALLLMDEPFGAIDALTREQLNADLQALWMRTPKTIIFVTHSISEAAFLADRVVVMSPRPGQIVEQLDIGLPRPRPLSILSGSEDFDKYTRHLRGVFEKVGVLRERTMLDESADPQVLP